MLESQTTYYNMYNILYDYTYLRFEFNDIRMIYKIIKRIGEIISCPLEGDKALCIRP